MKTILLLIVVFLCPLTSFSQAATFDFNQMLSFNKAGVDETTRYLTGKGWSISDEGEDTKPLPLEYRIFTLDRSIVKITWMRHLENVLQSFSYIDAEMDIEFNMQARAWIRQHDLILKRKDTGTASISPGAYQIVESYSKVVGTGMIFLDMGKFYLPSGNVTGYKYSITQMGGLK